MREIKFEIEENLCSILKRKIMKEKITLLLLFFSLAIFAQEKYTTDYEIEYELTFSQDSTDLENQKTEKMYLFSGSEYGVFVNELRAEAEEKLEKLKKKLGSKDIDIKLGVNTGQFADLNKAVFKDFQNNEIKVLQEIGGKDYIYIEPQKIDWEITEETKEFMGYQVQKAKTNFAGRTYESWFTLEIPIPDGPYIFHGLPGLIVEIYDIEKHYHFQMKSIDKLEESKTWKLPKTKISDKDKIDKIQQKIMKNALLNSDYSYMMGKTPGVTGSSMISAGEEFVEISDKSGNEITKEELKRRYKAELETRNNPIELE